VAPEAVLDIDPEEEAQQSLRLGQMLVERGVITSENLEAALEREREHGQPIAEALVAMEYATESDLLNCMAEQAGVPYLPLALYEVQPEVAALVPAPFVKKYRVVPVDQIANSVVVTFARPLSAAVTQELERLLDGHKINYYISARSEIEEKIEQLYPEPNAG